MRTDNREHLLWTTIITIEESLSGLQQGFEVFKEFTMRDFTPKVPPQHFNRIEPRTIGRQVQQHQTSCRGTHHGFDFIVLMGIGIIPGHLDYARGMLVHQGLQQFRHFTAALMTSK